MAIKPILFNTEMVKAILEGRKMQTRRILKPRHGGELEIHDDPGGTPRLCEKCGSICRGLIPPCSPGDILWVRETWDKVPVSPGGHFRFVGRYYYKADGDLRPDSWRGNWHPSIHMPKEAARIFLRVKDVRVERLQEIKPKEVEHEGALVINNPLIREDKDTYKAVANKKMARLWDSTIKPADRDRYGWDANPWVWVIEFERCEKPEGWH